MPLESVSVITIALLKFWLGVIPILLAMRLTRNMIFK